MLRVSVSFSYSMPHMDFRRTAVSDDYLTEAVDGTDCNRLNANCPGHFEYESIRKR